MSPSRAAAVEPPPALRAGDTIAVCAPSGPVSRERVARSVARLGDRFTLRYDDALFTRDGYLAGSDQRRADELNRALRDPDVRAILMARGGYGLLRILPELDAGALAADPKPIIGFSDGTALLSWAATAGVRGIHGPVLGQLGELDEADAATLIRLLTDTSPVGELPWHLDHLAGAPGTITGKLVGGNLTLLSHLVGTRWQVDSRDALLLVEDVGERPYEIDRFLTHLRLAGGLAGVRALIAGDFTRCTDPPTAVGGLDDPAAALAVIAERADAFGLPAVRGAPVGHGTRNHAFPWAARATLDGEVLTVHDAAVA